MFTQQTIDRITQVAASCGVEAAALLAVCEIESGGTAYAVVEGRQEPLIRFEGHYFDRRLTAAKRKTARAQGLASPIAGEIANPRSQAARWTLLDRACAIDRKAAYESVSWGIGQVMGAHWAWLGYPDVEALVADARADEAGQVRLMVRYIEKAGLAPALRAHDWHAFARGYNGPDYRKHGYHDKLAAAYKRHATVPRAAVAQPPDTVPEGPVPKVVLAGPSGPTAEATAPAHAIPAGFWPRLRAMFFGTR